MAALDRYNYDRRLRELVSSIDSPYQLFQVRAPDTEAAGYEPTSLDYLYLIEGFHTGCMPTSKFPRSQLIYDILVNRFTAFTSDIILLLNHVLYFKMFTDERFTQRELTRIKTLYLRYNIYKKYPLLNVLSRLNATMNVIMRFPVPHMQTQTICRLSPEIITRIAFACRRVDRRNFLTSCRTLYQAARRCVHMECTFVVKYDHSVNHLPARDSLQFEDSLFLAVQRSCTACVNTVWNFLNNADSLTHARLLAFDNQWERLLPVHTSSGPPSLLNLAQYKALYDAVGIVLQQSKLTHLRLTSLGVTRNIFHHISNSLTLTGLTLHSCTPGTFVLTPCNTTIDNSLQLANITYLAIGFCATTRDNYTCWHILQYCFNLRHFYAYPTDVDSVVVYPDRMVYVNIPHIHSLQRLHIDCGSTTITDLIGWLTIAAIRNSSVFPSAQGSLTHFKLSGKHGILPADATLLLDTLAMFHPGIRVLVLEGVMETTSILQDIGFNFRKLEGLGLFRQTNIGQRDLTLCQWELPSYECAVHLSNLPELRHFQCNFEYTPFTYGPSAFSAWVYPVHLDASYDSAEGNPYQRFDFDAAYLHDEERYGEMYDRLRREDSLQDGPAITMPFAAYCPKLESFAIKTDTTYFSCMVARLPTGSFKLYDIVDHHSRGGFQFWNPLRGSSWEYDTIRVD